MSYILISIMITPIFTPIYTNKKIENFDVAVVVCTRWRLLYARSALTYEMDTGVRLALSNQGAFGDRERAKNWVTECQVAIRKIWGFFSENWQHSFKKNRGLRVIFPKIVGKIVVFWGQW